VKGVIIGLRRMATVHELKGKAATEVQTVCGYFTNNASRMKYHEYLAAGCDGRMRGRSEPYVHINRSWRLSSPQDRCGWRSAVIVESLQDSTGRLCEESLVGVARAVTVTFRGFCDCHQSPHSYGPRMTAMTKRDLAKDDQGPQRAFGRIVRWRYARIIQKHEPSC